jgi:hypothetical protein
MAAGAALIDEAELHPEDRNELIYPILFNYRHGLELAMKWIIDYYGRMADVSLKGEDRDHNLLALWRMCKEILETAGQNTSDEATLAVEQVVKNFHDIDKFGVSLRYSFDKNGKPIVLNDGLIDLGNIQQVMEGVDGFFTGCDGLLSDLVSAAPTDY